MEQLRIKELSEFEKIDMINRLTAQLDASRALLAERDKLIENQQAEIESRNQLRYDAIRGEHSRSPYYYDSWCKLHDHKGVIGTSDKPPIHYAVNLLNRLTEQLAERDAEIRRLSRLLEIIRAGDVLDRAEKAEIGNASLRAEAERLKVDAEEIYKAYNYAVDEQISLKAKIAFWQSENVALRAEVERLKQNIVDTLTERLSDVETARKQAAQEIYNSLQKCFWAVDFETVRANLKHKFGLEG